MSDLFDFMDADRAERGQFNQVAEVHALQAEVIETKRKRLDAFKDIMPSIMSSKQYILDADNERDYGQAAFIINRALSYHDDAIFYAAEMNRLYELWPRAQYDFYFHSLRSKKRGFPSWGKVTKMADLAAVKTYFGYSDAKAMAALKILTEEQLVEIRRVTTPGESTR